MAKPRPPKDPYVKPPAGSDPVTNVPGTGSGKRADINEPAGGTRGQPPRHDPYVTPPAGSDPVTNVPGTGSGREADIDEPPSKT